MTASRNKTFQSALVCALLVSATVATYWPVTHAEFINYDDPAYIIRNPNVLSGVTWEGVQWAFSQIHGERTYWHPLTWLSHMLDCQLFGVKPGAHHAVNLLLHTLNTMLVFLVFLQMTRAPWRCAVLAGFFALHPLQVDTVAWVAERKNLLATLFGLLTIWAYASYVKAEGRRREEESRKQKAESRKPQPISRPPSEVHPLQSWYGGRVLRRTGCTFLVSRLSSLACVLYLLSLCFFALGLMCKPVLITLPFVLLLLDYWPLSRFQRNTQSSTLRTLLPLVREKIPFLLMAATSGVITILAHRGLGMLEAASTRPLGFRIENALVSYGRYLGKTLWPSKLAIFYPLPDAWPSWTVALSGVLLLAASALALGVARRRPYLFVGWFWFVGVLVPFIGLMQVGTQAMADRFAYLPLVGLFLALVWTVAESSRRWPDRSRILRGAAILLLLLCAVLSRRQVAHWRDSITVFEHALTVTAGNYLAHHNLGEALAKKGRIEEARSHLTAAMQLQPSVPETHYELGQALLKQERTSEAVEQYREALRLRPDWAGVLNNLAWLLATHPRAEFRNGPEAVPLAERACQLTGGANPAMLATLAAAYAEAGRFADAVSTQQKVCDLAAAQGPSAQLDLFQRRLELFRSGHAYHRP